MGRRLRRGPRLLAAGTRSASLVFTDSASTLAAGENNFAYVNDLTDTSNPNYPIVADGFVSGTPVGPFKDIEFQILVNSR